MEGHRALNRAATLLGAPALVGLSRKTDRPITGGFVNDSFPLGIGCAITPRFERPRAAMRVPIVIVGGGIAGLSAAWQLDKRGFRDFVLLEMEPQAGGNSRWGENEISKFPWAAHYVPVPAKGESLARELFEELGVFRDGKWDDRALCFDPQERLFRYGRWQEGIEPENGVAQAERDQYRRFNDRIMRVPRDRVNSPFPMERGAKPSPLDRISMADWLDERTLSIHRRCAGTSTTPAATITARWREIRPPGPASTTSPRAIRRKKVRSPGPRETAGSPHS